MKNLWWAYTTCTVLPMQELLGEEGGGLIIHDGHIIRTLRYYVHVLLSGMLCLSVN